MTLQLPIYLMVGEKPVSAVETADGGLALRGWDFARGELTRDAVEWDEIVGHVQEGVQVTGNTQIAEGGADTFRVTRTEFERRVEELRAGGASQPPDERQARRQSAQVRDVRARIPAGSVDVSNLERSIQDTHEGCEGEKRPPETEEMLREAAKLALGDESPTG